MPKTIDRDPPDAAPPGEPRSWLLKFGGVAFAGTVGSALAAAPAALRLKTASGLCSPLDGWALLFAVAIVPMTLAVVGLQRARAGLAVLGRGDRMTPMAMLLAWAVSCFVGMTSLGSFMRAHTHHRALGGVVFALLALAMAASLGLAFARIGSVLRRASPGVRWVIAALGVALLGVLVAVVRRQLGGEASPPFPPVESAKLVDGLAFALSALIASGYPFVQRRALALVGPPLAAIVLMLGVSSWRSCPSLCDAMEERAPLYSWLVGRGPADGR
jgi:hypothetical protein